MLPRHLDAAPDSRYVGETDVQVRRLDAIWDEIVPPAADPFLKLDVQGLEGAVLDGARDRISDLSGIQLEVSLVPLYEGAMDLREALDRMAELDMGLVDVRQGFTDPRTFELLQIDCVFVS